VTIKARVLRWLRIPHEPAAPPGDADIRIFRAAPNYFRYRLILWSLRQIAGLVAIALYLFYGPQFAPDFGPDRVRVGPVGLTRPTVLLMLNFFELVGLAIYGLQAAASGLILRLDYEQRWYLVSNRSLRIREGLVRLQERTMTFANVQHVAIRENPLQRWLGIADVEVRSAGGGHRANGDEHRDSSDLHVAYFRGVSDPAVIRDVIRDRLRADTGAGLGDPDDPTAARPAATVGTDLLGASRTLRDEARLLKAAVARSVSA
jgi:hypothetical protein